VRNNRTRGQRVLQCKCRYANVNVPLVGFGCCLCSAQNVPNWAWGPPKPLQATTLYTRTLRRRLLLTTSAAGHWTLSLLLATTGVLLVYYYTNNYIIILTIYLYIYIYILYYYPHHLLPGSRSSAAHMSVV